MNVIRLALLFLHYSTICLHVSAFPYPLLASLRLYSPLLSFLITLSLLLPLSPVLRPLFCHSMELNNIICSRIVVLALPPSPPLPPPSPFLTLCPSRCLPLHIDIIWLHHSSKYPFDCWCLQVFSKGPNWESYCLAHLFTYLAFDGVLGMGNIASPIAGYPGGICSTGRRRR